jgi:hypothetical protein
MGYIFSVVKSKVGNITHLSFVLQMWVIACAVPINMPIHQIHTYVLCFTSMVILTTDIAIIRNQHDIMNLTATVKLNSSFSGTHRKLFQ